MAFEPNRITREHILNAVKKIEGDNIELNPSTRWLVKINGKNYPPKEVMRYAHEQMNDEKIWERTGGEATNKFLKKFKFAISEKKIVPIKEMIENYKKRLKSNGLSNEIYKWQLLEKFKGKPDLNASDFFIEFNGIDYSNLIYHAADTVSKSLAKNRTEPYRACFRVLFDESKTLGDRIKYFDEETLKIYREIDPDKAHMHHQDERTISTFLTVYNPDKYTFFKDSFYQKYCKMIKIQAKKKGEKYVHYLELIDDFIQEYIKDDNELLSLVNKSITADCFQDNGHKILAQDILYQLDKSEPDIINITGHPMKKPLNQIFFGPPGTGKTYNTVNEALEIIGEEIKGKTRQEIKDLFDAKMKEGQIVFTTFHQSMSYEDFIEGIKPIEPDECGDVKYDVKPGIFKKLCDAAETPNQVDFNAAYENLKRELNNDEMINLKTPTGKDFSISLNSNDNLSLHTGKDKTKQGSLTKENIQKHINKENEFLVWDGYFKGVVNYLKTKYSYSSTQKETKPNFVIIIDEINRGNISQIFGELITLIEEDKRIDNDEALKVTLPYSKVEFGIPSNLYIIGTMNTADRSVEALDAALRRRFSFVEMQPRPDLIATEGKLKDKKGVIGTIDLPLLLGTINKRLEKLLDKDHQIGHSYFMNVTNMNELRLAFQNKIIPLLQEYFFGDYGKIGLVLGKDFFVSPEVQSEKIFADFGDYDASDFSKRTIYKIKSLSGMSEDDFNTAINTLLR